MKMTDVFPDRACAIIAACLVAVLVLALAILEAIGGEATTRSAAGGSLNEPAVSLTRPEPAPRFRPEFDLPR